MKEYSSRLLTSIMPLTLIRKRTLTATEHRPSLTTNDLSGPRTFPGQITTLMASVITFKAVSQQNLEIYFLCVVEMQLKVYMKKSKARGQPSIRYSKKIRNLQI